MLLIVGMDDEAKRIRKRLVQRQWRAKHPEQHRAAVKAWRLANPDKAREIALRRLERQKAKRLADREARRLASADMRAAAKALRREKERQRSRERYLANRERNLEQSKKWREANPEKSKTLQKAWRDRNPEKRRKDKRARKTAKRVTLVRELTRLQRGRCAYCRVKLDGDLQVDHVMPLKRGGPDKRPNLQLACVDCNSAKAARDPIEFAQSTGRLL